MTQIDVFLGFIGLSSMLVIAGAFLLLSEKERSKVIGAIITGAGLIGLLSVALQQNRMLQEIKEKPTTVVQQSDGVDSPNVISSGSVSIVNGKQVK